MKGFKLLAIRPLEGCNSRFVKNLIPNKVYQFYHDYNFDVIDNEVTISKNENRNQITSSIYSTGGLEINISAIVGENGSGKSSLIELLYAMIYNLAVDVKLISEVEILEKFISDAKPVEDLYLELYFLLNDNMYCLKSNQDKTNKWTLLMSESIRESRSFKLSQILEKDKIIYIRKFFFYTVSVNYSLYGLNSSQIGIWIKSLFHKNDGYQTPIVINPYREEGNIDINKEQYLAKQRLIGNILRDHIEHPNHNFSLTKSQRVQSITFKLNESKLDYVFINREGKVSFENFYKIHTKSSVLKEVYKVFFDSKDINENIKFKDEIENYIVKKIIKIATTYPEYNHFFRLNLNEHIGELGDTKNKSISYNTHFNNLPEFLSIIKDNNSHLTFKLKQAINYLKNNLLEEKDGLKWIANSDEILEFEIDIETLTKRILKIENNQLITLIPPSLFDIEINLLSTEGSISKFSELSSGEQQLIHSIQSVIYHSTNLESVHFSNTKNKLKYESLNIIFDEVELYFHPDYQKKFISELVSSLSKNKFKKIKNINILFSTHSPFILSDIPSQNILKLINGDPQPFVENEQTFGANIHELLANDFFLKKGFIGEFAKEKINSLIDFLKSENIEDDTWNEDYAFQCINIIGENLIKNTLLEIYYEKFQDKLETQIERLISLKKKQ
jgi:predicted ATP-binding protein involved in virulence